MSRKVSVTVSEGILDVEWEPDVEMSTECCATEELVLQSNLIELGIIPMKVGISCKLVSPPKDDCPMKEDLVERKVEAGWRKLYE